MNHLLSTADAEMRHFLEGLRDLVLTEMEAQRQQISDQWRKPLSTRVADGYAIEGVRVSEIRTDGKVELTCPRNVSRFRPGDVLCLSHDDPFFAGNPMLTLDEDEETKLIVSSELPVAWDQLSAHQEPWTLDIGFVDLSSYIISALVEAGDTRVGRERILPLLMQRVQPDIDPVLYAHGLALGEERALNWSQSEALANAYATDLAYLVQGPPGTGKTRVLATLARALVQNGERVLVCAFTHRAINNALNAIARFNPGVPAIKVGDPTRADDLRVKNYETFHESPLADEGGGYIVGATPFATRTRRLGGVAFDTIIFDEASQITLPLAIMGMLAGQKYVFFGDQKQLPPVLTTRMTGGAFRESVFGTLVDGNFDTMLTETYRLNDALAGWPSRQFYDGLLTSAPQAAGGRIQYHAPPRRLDDVLAPHEPKVFWDLGHHNHTTYCHQEASAVVDLITTLLACGTPAAEIGVVAPYRAQGRLLRNMLRAYVPEPAIRRQLVVDTVERMQGQERDLIILSLTTSNPGFAANVAEFFFQPERLNVAITRPRYKLIIVGSRFVLNAQPFDAAFAAMVDLLDDLLTSCKYIPLTQDISPQVWESEW